MTCAATLRTPLKIVLKCVGYRLRAAHTYEFQYLN